jgi:hypothetical protein
MSERKSSISKASSYEEIGEYWDNHDVTGVWDQTRPVEFEVAISSERRYYPIEKTLSQKLSQIADAQGISAETLVNLWIQEKIVQSES